MNYTREATTCSHALPVMSVGDVNITKPADYFRMKKLNDFFILGLTDTDKKECPLCCDSEYILNEVHQLFKNGTFQYHVRKKGHPIKIARLDISK